MMIKMMAKLTLKEAKTRFKKTGECSHDPDWETKVNPYGCDVVQVICEACNKLKRTYYI